MNKNQKKTKKQSKTFLLRSHFVYLRMLSCWVLDITVIFADCLFVGVLFPSRSLFKKCRMALYSAFCVSKSAADNKWTDTTTTKQKTQQTNWKYDWNHTIVSRSRSVCCHGSWWLLPQLFTATTEILLHIYITIRHTYARCVISDRFMEWVRRHNFLHVACERHTHHRNSHNFFPLFFWSQNE